jgi:hypothetical protein
VGHQEGAGEPRKHAQQGGGLGQFGVQESDFESNSESRTTLLSNNVQDASDLRFGLYTYAWKDKEIVFPMPPVSWSTKIGVGRNHQNKTDF